MEIKHSTQLSQTFQLCLMGTGEASQQQCDMVLSSCPCPRGPDSSLRAQLLHQPACSTGWVAVAMKTPFMIGLAGGTASGGECPEDDDGDDDGLDVREEHGCRHPHASAGPEPVQR